MLPLEDVPGETWSRVLGVATDLDDTLTTHGWITPVALGALGSLAEAGIPCVVATGRPVGWAEVLARILPVRAVVAENGGAWALREGGGVRVAFTDPEPVRAEALARATRVATRLQREFPGLERVVDWTVRATDVTLDIGERAKVPRATVDQCLAIIREEGLYGVASTVHLHIGGRSPDKTEGLRAALADARLDPGELTERWVYVGDSPNDEGPFRSMALSVGVAGVRRFALAHPPRYVTRGDAGEGFAEVTDTVLSHRAGARGR